jgi:S-adenosylmethionine hydrolase
MIAIFTDFGIQGPYLGQMKAVLFHEVPGVPVADVFPDLPPFNVKAAAYLLPAYSQYLPDDTVCLCVVDPGVGTDRRALAVHADERWYLGPDNGLFSIVIRRARKVQVYEVSWRPVRLSSSFHGRDLFAPVAARLARSEGYGQQIDVDALTMPGWPDDLAEVAYIDQYGNAVTGLRASGVSREAILEVNKCRCEWRRVFGEARTDEPFWYENSNGLIEIAMSQDNVAKRLGLTVGTEVGMSG